MHCYLFASNEILTFNIRDLLKFFDQLLLCNEQLQLQRVFTNETKHFHFGLKRLHIPPKHFLKLFYSFLCIFHFLGRVSRNRLYQWKIYLYTSVSLLALQAF